MPFRIISRKTIREFYEIHSDCEQALSTWYHDTLKANWSNPNDVKLEYPSVSILPSNRMVFNIKGNKYRLIVKINFGYQMIWIRFIGTHAEYDKINAVTI